MVWTFAPLTGFGICSVIVFLFRRPMFTVEISLLIVLLTLWIRTHGIPLDRWREMLSWRAPLLGVIFAIIVGWSVSSSIVHVNRYPNGLTDAWAIWDSHA